MRKMTLAMIVMLAAAGPSFADHYSATQETGTDRGDVTATVHDDAITVTNPGGVVAGTR